MTQNLELVEKLVEKTGLSYTEAKAALERTDWDILEAIILLETEGKVQNGKTTHYTTDNENRDAGEQKQSTAGKQSKEKNAAGENFKKSAKSFGDWLKEVFDKGNKNCLVMHKNSEKKIELPVTAFLVLLIFCFWVVIPLMIVALFFGCRFSFSGQELGKDSVNSAMGKATDFADNIKSEFKTNEK